METIVDRIRALCRQKDTSITKIEVELGYANGTIGKWAKGKKTPPLEKIIAIAARLGTTAEYLTSGKQSVEQSKEEIQGNVVDRIRGLCKKSGITLAELERRCGIGNGVIARWGKSSPSYERLARVAKELETSVEYLQTGGEQRESSNMDIKLPEKYYKLSEENRQAIDKMIMFFYEQQGKG